jgi:hypothetical protein
VALTSLHYRDRSTQPELVEPISDIIPFEPLVTDLTIFLLDRFSGLFKINTILLSISSRDSFEPDCIAKIWRYQRALDIERDYLNIARINHVYYLSETSGNYFQ